MWNATELECLIDLDLMTAVAGPDNRTALVEARTRLAPRDLMDGVSMGGRLEPHQVLLLSYPRAHAYALTATREPKTRRRLIAAGGEVLAEVTVPNRFRADLAKYAALDTVDAHRCVAPQALVPIGRTDCWRETGGHQRPALALWQATSHPQSVDTATAERITGRPADQLQALAAEGVLATLPGRAGQPAGRPAQQLLGDHDRSRPLGVSRQHAHRLRDAGKFPAQRTSYGLWVARRSDLPPKHL